MVLLARSSLFYMIGTSLPQIFLSVLWLILVNLTVESPFFMIMLNKVGFRYFLPHILQTKQMEAVQKIPSSCTMFPSHLCYVWTIWKVQGQTLSLKVIAYLGDTEKEHGLSYTVFSRVTSCSLLRIPSGLPFNGLTKKFLHRSRIS